MTVLSVIAIASSLGAKAPVSERAPDHDGLDSRVIATLLPQTGSGTAARSETCDSARKHSALDGVAHRSEQAHPSLRTASPDCSDTRWAYLLNHASATGRSVVGVRSNCHSARKAVAFYKARVRYWKARAHKMGAESSDTSDHGRPRSGVRFPQLGCPQIHRAVTFWRAKAREWRLRYQRWHHEYAWWDWLPSKFRRVGHCETGSTAGGTAAGNWQWDSGRYVSAFGIYRPAYEAYHRWTGRNTPREQYEVAASIQARFGWGAWGCGSA